MSAAALVLLLLASPPAGPDALAAAIAAGEFPRTTSVLLARGRQTVHEAYFGGTDAQTLHDPRSVGKSVTALAVGIAIGEGKIASVDASAFSYLTDLRPYAHDGPAKRAITIADLLTMSSALDCDDGDDQSPGNEELMYPLAAWTRWAVDLPVKTGYTRDARGRGPFAYCTAGTHLLGQILQRATGTPVDRYIESRLLAPLGIGKVIWMRSPTGEVLTGGGLRMRTRDLAVLGRLLLDGGRRRGKQVVPESWVRAALSPQIKPNASQDPEGRLDYGYLFFRGDHATACGPRSAWYMSGNGGNRVLILKDLDAVAVVTRTNYNAKGTFAQTVDLLQRHLLPRLGCPTVTPPAPARR